MIVELKDKGIELEFPDDMPLEKIRAIIDSQFYADHSMDMTSSPMPAVSTDTMLGFDKSLTENAPLVGAMLPGPLAPIGAGIGKAYQMLRTGEQAQLPAWSERTVPGSLSDVVTGSGQPYMDAVPGGIPEAFPKPINLIPAMGMGAAGAAAGKVAETVIPPVVGAVTAPFKGTMDKAIAESATAQAAKQMADAGLPVGVSQYAPSRTGRAMTWALDKFPLSSSMMNSYRSQLNEALMAMRQDLVQGQLGMVNPSKMFPTKGEVSEAFSDVLNAVGGPKVEIPTPNLKAYVDEVLGSDIAATDQFWSQNTVIQKLKNQNIQKGGHDPLHPPERYAENLNPTESFLWNTKQRHPEITTDEGLIHARVQELMQGFPGLKYDQAAKFIRDDIATRGEWFQKVGREGLSKPSEVPKLAASDINDLSASLWKIEEKNVYNKLSPAQRELRKGLRKAMENDFKAYDDAMDTQVASIFEGAEATSRLRHDQTLKDAKFVEGLLAQSTKLDSKSQMMQFRPAIFNDLVRRNEDRLYRALGKDKFELLKQFDQKAMASVPDMAKFSQKMSLGDVLLSGSMAGAAGYGGYTDNPWIAVPALFSPVVAMSLMKPSGWLRKWLSTGFKPPTMAIKTGAKVATLEAFSE
jgi:hypothetical protein